MNTWQEYETHAYTAMEQRDYRAAHLAFTHAIHLRQEHGDPDPPHTARLWNNVGALCRELDDSGLCCIIMPLSGSLSSSGPLPVVVLAH